jgi:hypothetical protein
MGPKKLLCGSLRAQRLNVTAVNAEGHGEKN